MENPILITIIIAGVAALASVVTVIITFWYTRLTQKILKETNRPEISVTLEFRTRSYESSSQTGFTDTHYETNLVVENTGTGVARHVSFDGDFSFTPVHSDKALNEIDFLIDGIDPLKPGDIKTHKVVVIIPRGAWDKIFNKDLYKDRESTVPIEMSYKNVRGQSYENEPFVLDFVKTVDLSSYTTK